MSLNINICQSFQPPLETLTDNTVCDICCVGARAAAAFLKFTWEVSEWQVRLGEMSSANHHGIKNTGLPLTLSALRLHLPLTRHFKICRLPHADYSSLTQTQTQFFLFYEDHQPGSVCVAAG